MPEQLNGHVVIVELPAAGGHHRAAPAIQPSQHLREGIGSPLSSFDLHRIHIDRTSAIVILASSKRKYIDENMVDADAITTVRYINEACPGSKPPNLIVEFVQATKFMSWIVMRHMNHHRRPPRRHDMRHSLCSCLRISNKAT
ncbi:hypothetical protein H310_01845 [Aphanomyces invadans]|uniref:RCK N-terminal domain-containing protein n=1 Tax=Aphanomyces invadans TaxID=157072 RepID=A0A024ULV8_9STRA|nr:hypothetical protein H310_01845 [Aphanomyces invadans]ETW07289.1 hypothetical protein H310_01845 [Aphanomyces invadans]|eukprot:XP_008863382.1 hypothetical protein H310_01845 [Aphanomyces invadans]